MGSFAVPVALLIGCGISYLVDRTQLATVLGGVGGLSGIAIWHLGVRRLRWMIQSYFQSWHETTQSIDLWFTASIANLTSPFGGWLQTLATALFSIEAVFSGRSGVGSLTS